jgi:hypothetical protein
MNLNINWWRVTKAVLVGCVLLPWVLMIPPAGTPADQVKLDRIVARIERLEASAETQKLREVLAYTARKYRRVERLNVRILPLRLFAGMNIPWSPGVTINRKDWDSCDAIALEILVHEAMHDYPPYLTHWHIEGWVIGCRNDEGLTELERLMREVK